SDLSKSGHELLAENLAGQGIRQSALQAIAYGDPPFSVFQRSKDQYPIILVLLPDSPSIAEFKAILGDIIAPEGADGNNGYLRRAILLIISEFPLQLLLLLRRQHVGKIIDQPRRLRRLREFLSLQTPYPRQAKTKKSD